jgi:diguanylate cyclase (GGDEF)-like protein
MCLRRSQADPRRIFIGLNDGLASMYRRNEGQGFWQDEGKVPGISEEIRTIVEMADGRLWLGSDSKGFLRVTFFKGWQGGASGPAPMVERFGLEQGLPVWMENYVYSTGGKPLFSTHQGIYRFDESSKRFVPDQRFAFFPEGPRWMAWLCADAQGRIWLDSTDEANKIHEPGVAFPTPDGHYQWEKTPFLRFADMIVWAIQADNDGVAWFGGPDGLVRYDPCIAKNYNQVYAALICHVDKKSGGQPIFAGPLAESGSKTIPILKFAENDLSFEFALPAFDQAEANRYRIFLEGSDRKWSPWTALNSKEYMNLPEGRYAFRVKAHNIYERESGEAVFRFVISPPWYRTWPAYLGFFIAGLGIIVGIVRAYTFRLQREKERLEKLVALRTQELKEASLTDPLTGLRNRRFIQEILTNDITAFVNFKKYLLSAKDRRQIEEMQHTVFGLLLFDIDHFKVVNDTHGHDAGDQVLQQFAQLLKDAVRADDAVLRIGGEEFLIVLKKTKLEYLDIFVEKIMKRVQETGFVIGENLTIRRTCSIGYTVFPFYADQPERLSFEQTMMVADLGLYHAKEQGRNLAVRIGAASHVPQNEEEVKKMVTSLEFAQQLKFTKVNKLSLS